MFETLHMDDTSTLAASYLRVARHPLRGRINGLGMVVRNCPD